MEKIGGAYKYSNTAILVLGILGNISVILSILGLKNNLLKKNYYFVVLHLAICDLVVPITYLFTTVETYWLKEPLFNHSSVTTCHVYVIADAFQSAGVGMMLTISLLRHRGTVHPLKPVISRRKLQVVCGLVYFVGLIAGGGTRLPLCFIKSNFVLTGYMKFYGVSAIVFVFLFPTIFMGVVYYKIYQALTKQNKYLKRVCPNAMRRHYRPASPFNILSYTRNRRAFLVCLSTVLCYGIGHIPISVWFMWDIVGKYHLQVKYVWVQYFAYVLNVAGSHSVNPLIYGILDKKLLKFCK